MGWWGSSGGGTPHGDLPDDGPPDRDRGSAARGPPCPRGRRPHGALRATHRAPRRAWSAGTAEQSVRSTVVEAADQPTTCLVSRHRLQPRPSPRCAARASPRRRRRTQTVRAANRAVGRPAQSLHTGALTPPMVAARLMSWRLLHSLAPSPGTRLQRNVGPPPSRSPSRRSQVVVRRGQRWRRQMPRGSSTRSSPRSMARRAQCPPSIRRMRVRRARPSRTNTDTPSACIFLTLPFRAVGTQVCSPC